MNMPLNLSINRNAGEKCRSAGKVRQHVKQTPTFLKKSFTLKVDGDRGKPTAIRKEFDIECKDSKSGSNGWKSKPVSKWNSMDVMNWLTSVAVGKDIRLEDISLYKFNLKGEDLLRMSKFDFHTRNPVYGHKLYSEFQEHLSSESSHSPPAPILSTVLGDVKRGRGRPKGTHTNSRKSKSKRCKLWEFLVQLLAQPEYSSVIHWEDQEKGTFRITQSEKIAELWGESRGKKGMDYVKMSRLMRYYYKNGELVSNKQRLVYQFGHKSTGWRLPTVDSN